MILVDSSVWIDHLRSHDAGLSDLLNRGLVLSHPFVIGELALDSLRRRAEITRLWTRDRRLNAVALELGLAASHGQ